MELSAKKFSYDTEAVSQKLFQEHLKLYNGYVGKVNEITDTLKDSPDLAAGAGAVYSRYRELKKEETFALDGVILHELYFKNMTSKKNKPGKKTLASIEAHFGSFEKWAKDFVACAKSARGWCLFSYDQRTSSFRNFLADAHDQGIVCMAFPVLVLDVYEHAYFQDYGADRAKYIQAFMDSVNWDVVEKRIEAVS